jgi:hypothetical protein
MYIYKPLIHKLQTQIKKYNLFWYIYLTKKQNIFKKNNKLFYYNFYQIFKNDIKQTTNIVYQLEYWSTKKQLIKKLILTKFNILKSSFVNKKSSIHYHIHQFICKLESLLYINSYFRQFYYYKNNFIKYKTKLSNNIKSHGVIILQKQYET